MGALIIACQWEAHATSSPLSSGGTITNNFLLRAWAKVDDVHLIAPNVTNDFLAEMPSGGMTVDTITARRRGVLNRVQKRRWILDALNKALAKAGPNVVAVTGSATTHDLVQAAVEARNVPAVCVIQAFEDMPRYRFERDRREQFRAGVLRQFDRRMHAAVRRAHLVVVNSRFMENEVQNYFGSNRTRVLYPPIESTVKGRRVPTTSPRIGMVNPTVRKGSRIFVEVASALPSLEFHDIGRPTSIRTSANIMHQGWRPGDAIFDDTDILLVPSQWPEPFGRVAVEATSAGIPSLVSGTGGLPETVDDRLVVAEYRRANAWVDKIEWCLRQPGQVAEAVEQSQRLADFFSTHRYNLTVASVHQELSESRQRPPYLPN